MAGNNGPKIVTSGLILALDAADKKSYAGSGTAWNDLSGNNRNGTLVNGPTFLNSNGGVINLDGVDDHISNNYLPSGAIIGTFSFWFYLNANLSFKFGGASGTQYGWVLYTGNALYTIEMIFFTNDLNQASPAIFALGSYGGGGTGSCYLSGLNMPIQRWHNFVVTFTNGSQVIYQNGVQIGTGNFSQTYNAGTSKLGAATADPAYLGLLSVRFGSVIFYNRILSASEVLQNFNATRGRFGI